MSGMRRYRRPEEGTGFRIDAGNLPFLLAGAALVLVLVFLLGVFTGRVLWAPSKGGPPPAPRTEARPEAPRPAPGSAPAPAEERELTFYRELKKPPEPPADGAGEKPGPPPAPAPEAGKKGEAAGERQRAKPQPAAKPPKAAEAARTLPPPVFTVQVGSFRSRRKAEDLAARMREQGVQVQVVEASVAGRTWYRVQVGRFDTRAAAEAHYRKHLRPRGIRGFVTTR